MCLQSSCTGDELYVQEFFLPKSTENNENILTKLRLILETMEIYFKTFKLASGQGLGEALSVEVIDFQYGQRSRSIEMIPATRFIPSLELVQDGGVMLQQVQQDQPSMDAINNGMYVVSETQNYNFPCLDSFMNGKVTTQLDSSDQPSMDPSSNRQNVVTAKRNILVVPSSKERKKKMQDRKRKKAGVRIEVSLEEILKCSNMKREDAARELKGLFGGQQTLFSPLLRQGLQSAEGELSIVPTVHTAGGVPNVEIGEVQQAAVPAQVALSFPSFLTQAWLDAHFSYTPTIDEEETINKCMQDGSFRGEFVDGCWISNITVMEYSEMLDHYLSHCHFFGPNVIAHFLNHEFVFKRLTEQNEWPIKYPENTPIQDNGNDCGVYMMAFMISLVVGDKLPQLSQAQLKRMRRTICLELKKWDIIPQCPLVDYNFLYIQERKKIEALNEKLHKESTAALRDEVVIVSERRKHNALAEMDLLYLRQIRPTYWAIPTCYHCLLSSSLPITELKSVPALTNLLVNGQFAQLATSATLDPLHKLMVEPLRYKDKNKALTAALKELEMVLRSRGQALSNAVEFCGAGDCNLFDTGGDSYILEFFLPASIKDDESSWNSLSMILGMMIENSKTFNLASGQKVGEVLSAEVIDFQNGGKLHFVQTIQAIRSFPFIEPLKHGGVTMELNSLDQPSPDGINHGVKVLVRQGMTLCLRVQEKAPQ
ncbi:hypothetical protein RHSIM_Rhsim02G0246300 [Rhododendron simsii]|uniref:Ubiquitin-like protease family profile domain-containing protein n=1 Tax=Rhododendron simsii TaxID=118357 RepID=A0A834LVN9_RHOSS|nr:hypothetical protein RHSIM_Rhsim02G0246300 [Rhododendron simsii]